MRLSITEMWTNLIYLKIGGCDLHTGTTNDGINFRLYYSKKKDRNVHLALSHNDSYSKKSFADSYPCWSFDPTSNAWLTMIRFSNFITVPALERESVPELENIIQNGCIASNLYFDKDGEYFYRYADGEVFSLPCTAVLELQYKIEYIQGAQ